MNYGNTATIELSVAGSLGNSLESQFEKSDGNQRYRELVRLSCGLSSSGDVNIRRKNLSHVYPDKFGLGQEKDISKCDDTRVIEIYLKILKDAKRTLRREARRKA